MFIQSDIFKGELKIPFSTDNSSCINSKQLDWFINKYEGPILRTLLGQLYYELKKAHEDEIIVDGDKWDILLNGGEYQVGDNTYTWTGLKYLVACFLYFYITRDNAIQTTAGGGKVVEYESAENVSPRIKGINNWNNATRLIKPVKCNESNVGETLIHYLDNGDFENYCVNFFEGGIITNVY